MGHKEATPIIAGLLNALSQPSEVHGTFQRIFILDEVNRYDRDPLVWQHLLTAARQIRHRGSVLVLLG
jgi:hypothetical protein